MDGQKEDQEMNQTRRKRIERLVRSTLVKISRMEDGLDDEDFWAPVLRRFYGIGQYRGEEYFRFFMPFSVWVNKQAADLSEKDIFDCIFLGRISPQLDLFGNDRADFSKFIKSSEVLRALGRLIQSNGKISLAIRDLAGEIFKDAPEVLRKRALL